MSDCSASTGTSNLHVLRMQDEIRERVAGMTVQQLRSTIVAAGLSHDEVVEKNELRRRAFEALQLSMRIAGIGTVANEDGSTSVGVEGEALMHDAGDNNDDSDDDADHVVHVRGETGSRTARQITAWSLVLATLLTVTSFMMGGSGDVPLGPTSDVQLQEPIAVGPSVRSPSAVQSPYLSISPTPTMHRTQAARHAPPPPPTSLLPKLLPSRWRRPPPKPPAPPSPPPHHPPPPSPKPPPPPSPLPIAPKLPPPALSFTPLPLPSPPPLPPPLPLLLPPPLPPPLPFPPPLPSVITHPSSDGCIMRQGLQRPNGASERQARRSHLHGNASRTPTSFYVYAAAREEDITFENVVAGDLLGVLLFLHHEVGPHSLFEATLTAVEISHVLTRSLGLGGRLERTTLPAPRRTLPAGTSHSRCSLSKALTACSLSLAIFSARTQVLDPSCPRRFGITRIRRYRVTTLARYDDLATPGGRFADFVAFDGGRADFKREATTSVGCAVPGKDGWYALPSSRPHPPSLP